MKVDDKLIAFLRGGKEDFTEEELTFYLSDDEYREFQEELKAFTQ